jgi:hypothetical protein
MAERMRLKNEFLKSMSEQMQLKEDFDDFREIEKFLESKDCFIEAENGVLWFSIRNRKYYLETREGEKTNAFPVLGLAYPVRKKNEIS